MEKACNIAKETIKKWGPDNAKKIQQRLTELKAAENLSHISYLPPPRLHPLGGEKAGQYAVDVKHPFRLVFKPHHQPVLLKPDGSVDLTKITALLILDVEDYHGK